MGNTFFTSSSKLLILSLVLTAALPVAAESYTIINSVQSSHHTGGNYSGSGQAGTDGTDGTDGQAGQDGWDGADGKDGADGTVRQSGGGNSRAQVLSEVNGQTMYSYDFNSGSSSASATVTQTTSTTSDDLASPTASASWQLLELIRNLLSTYVSALR